MSKLRVLDLFSGIGGFSLGLERTGGFKTVAFCEIDPFCRAVLKRHWPEVPIYGDIRQLRGDELGAVDFVAAGPPCQPVSLAGKRRGKEDDRWLWEETLCLVEKLRPRWCLFENPLGFVSMGLDDVLARMEERGYETGTIIIPACALNAPHIRQRVFVLAYTCSKRLSESKQKRQLQVSATERGWRKAQSRLGRDFARLSPWLDGHRWPAPLGCEQYEWEPPRITAGKTPYRRQRLMALGNAVVPQIVEVIGYAILEAEKIMTLSQAETAKI